MGRIKCDKERCAKAHRLHYGSGLPVFKGETHQMGYGLGSLLSGLARTVLPVIAPIAKRLGKTALETGSHILGDVISGRDNIKSSARKRIADAIEDHFEPDKKRLKKSRKIRHNKRRRDIFD